MKRILLILLAALFATTVVTAQTSREEIDAYPHVAMSTQSVYAAHYFAKPLAKAPKGYEPFYISHYGRHGSRYESRAYYTQRVADYFHVADSLGILTPKGKEAKALFEKINDTQKNYIGELTRIGVEQHKGIARRMYNNFRPIFKRGAIINSRSSSRSRCILSMAAFNEGLKECKPLLETRLSASQADQKMIRPLDAIVTDYDHDTLNEIDHEWRGILAQWEEKQDLSHAANSLFTDIKTLCNHTGKSEVYILTDIYKRLAFMQNLGWHDRSLIDSVFTPKERHTIYLRENYRWFCTYAGTSLPDAGDYFKTMYLLVDDIIKYTDLAIEGKNSASADLRFGHDYYLLGLHAVANFNEVPVNCDYSDIAKLGEAWRGYRHISMASNIQFILYRSKKSSDILVRILLNESDATLPIDSSTTPFYKWEDVRNHLNARAQALRK